MYARRNIELSLLVLALILSVGAYVIVGLSQDNRIPAGVLGYGAILGGVFLGAHLVLRVKAPAADPVLLPGAALLNGLGLVMIRRLDFATGEDQAQAQILWTILGFTAFALVILLLRDYRRLEGYRYIWLLVGVVLLLAPFLPVVGREINGARVWIRLGPLQFQPAEAAKLALVVFFAAYLRDAKELLATGTHRAGRFLLPPLLAAWGISLLLTFYAESLGSGPLFVGIVLALLVGRLLLPQVRYFLPLLAAWGISLLVMFFEKDLGSSLLFFGIFLALLYVATGRFAYVAVGLGLFAQGAILAYRLFGHVRLRLNIWLDPWADFEGDGFQLAQSLFSLANGGLLGTGWGEGQPGLIPFASTDFVFAALGEELGLAGTAAIVLVFLLMVFRGIRIALTANDEFGTLLATGLVAGFALQVFVIIGGVTRLIPLTGLTLPFVSYGGSSLVSNYVLVAVLLLISSTSAPPPPAKDLDRADTGTDAAEGEQGAEGVAVAR